MHAKKETTDKERLLSEDLLKVHLLKEICLPSQGKCQSICVFVPGHQLVCMLSIHIQHHHVLDYIAMQLPAQQTELRIARKQGREEKGICYLHVQ